MAKPQEFTGTPQPPSELIKPRLATSLAEVQKLVEQAYAIGYRRGYETAQKEMGGFVVNGLEYREHRWLDAD